MLESLLSGEFWVHWGFPFPFSPCDTLLQSVLESWSVMGTALGHSVGVHLIAEPELSGIPVVTIG